MLPMMKPLFCATALAVLCAINPAQAEPAADPLKDWTLPAADREPWRFTEFPILAWWGPPGSATLQDFQNYKDAGINIYLPNPDLRFEQAVTKATSVGLAMMPFRTVQGFAGPGRAKDNPVRFPEDHPNIVGWLTSDEPGNVDAVKATVTQMNELMRQDPTRWTLFNCLPVDHVQGITDRQVIDAAIRNGQRIISFDNYVIHGDGASHLVALYRNLEVYRQASVDHNVPFWAFALTIQHWHYRRASESDVRWKQFTNLAYGAKGLWYFTYWAPRTEDKWEKWDTKAIVDGATGEKTELYDYVKAINENVQSVGQVLLRLTNDDVYHTSVTVPGTRAFEAGRHWIADIKATDADNTDALVSFFRDEKDGTRYAWIVNNRHGMDMSAEDGAVTFEVRFAPRARSVSAVAWLDGTTGPLALDDEGRATMKIAGGTGVLLRLDE